VQVGGILVVQYGYQREPERAQHCTGKGMQHSVPLREYEVKIPDFTQVYSAIKKHEIQDEHIVRNRYSKSFFDNRRDKRYHDRQQTLNKA
jgi:hypothetical protein